MFLKQLFSRIDKTYIKLCGRPYGPIKTEPGYLKTKFVYLKTEPGYLLKPNSFILKLSQFILKLNQFTVYLKTKPDRQGQQRCATKFVPLGFARCWQFDRPFPSLRFTTGVIIIEPTNTH